MSGRSSVVGDIGTPRKRSRAHPHLGPLPKGEEETLVAASTKGSVLVGETRPSTFPLPAGEGKGEGENFLSTTAVLYLLFLATLFASFPVAHAGPQPLHTNAPPVSAGITNPAITKIDADTFQIGKVRLNKNKHTVTFPASVNMREGNIEYLLVHTTGKVHESLLKTDAEPYHVNVALLLLGAKGGVIQTKTPQKKTSDISGDKLDVFIAWKTNGTEMNFRAEDLVIDVETKSTAARGAWIYNGSRVIDGSFLAQRDGSIISTIADPDALVNNPRPERDNDDAWLVNTTNTPPVNTPVQVIFQLQNGQSQ